MAEAFVEEFETFYQSAELGLC